MFFLHGHIVCGSWWWILPGDILKMNYISIQCIKYLLAHCFIQVYYFTQMLHGAPLYLIIDLQKWFNCSLKYDRIFWTVLVPLLLPTFQHFFHVESHLLNPWLVEDRESQQTLRLFLWCRFSWLFLQTALPPGKDRSHCPIIGCTIHHKYDAFSFSYPSVCYNPRAGDIYHPFPQDFLAVSKMFCMPVVLSHSTTSLSIQWYSIEFFSPLYAFVPFLYCYLCILAIETH